MWTHLQVVEVGDKPIKPLLSFISSYASNVFITKNLHISPITNYCYTGIIYLPLLQTQQNDLCAFFLVILIVCLFERCLQFRLF